MSYTDWIGRAETTHDLAAEAPITTLAALLDHETAPWPPGAIPPLGHWLYFLPRPRQSRIGPDGHPARGGFLPPVALPRRMWAGSRLTFPAPLPFGRAIRRVSTIAAVQEKSGSSGQMVFVSVRHEIFADGALSVIDEHDIVFREDPQSTGKPGAAAPPPPPPLPDAMRPLRTVTPDEVMLFRYSALTLNGHRIHYDKPYATQVEGYPGLVIHGPLTATLIADAWTRETGGRIAAFSFRAKSPLFLGTSVTVHGDIAAGELVAVGSDGRVAMEARITAA